MNNPAAATLLPLASLMASSKFRHGDAGITEKKLVKANRSDGIPMPSAQLEQAIRENLRRLKP